MTIAELLAQSRAAHARYRQIHSQSKGTNLHAMGATVQEALSTRLDAEALDPERTDPAWVEDQQATRNRSHRLVEFFAGYLTPRDSSPVI